MWCWSGGLGQHLDCSTACLLQLWRCYHSVPMQPQYLLPPWRVWLCRVFVLSAMMMMLLLLLDSLTVLILAEFVC